MMPARGLPQEALHRVRRFRQDMGIVVKRGRGQGVAEHGGNYRDRQAVRDQETRGRMAHVIEAKRLRQPSGGKAALVFLCEVASIEWYVDCRGKDESGFLLVRAGALMLELMPLLVGDQGRELKPKTASGGNLSHSGQNISPRSLRFRLFQTGCPLSTMILNPETAQLAP
jgi:hypothetical protein